MRVPVKLFVFSFWLFFLNGARCQDCPRDDINLENTELAEKASYTHGQTVKVNCIPGYIGFYKIKCERGKWKTTIQRPCAIKKCNHPGDAQNGDFKIIGGKTEFVFGATVEYTCKKGHEMTSRISQRTCRGEGWDNAVPECEAVRCPVILTEGDVIASGNTEEGRYSDVIHFECVSSDKKIDGSSDIHCTETGEWSGAVPECKAITCKAPHITNGTVVEEQLGYQKDAILKYRCDEGFKPREGIPRCAKFGWTIKPECDEVTCELKSVTFGVKMIRPIGKNIFRAGETLEITCSEKHWIFFTKEKSKEFTCQYTGKWDNEPVCEDIRCEVPWDQHVSSPDYYFTDNMKLGVTKYYRCRSGYRKTASDATCTLDGWTPDPLCAEIMCEAPNIPNAEIVGYLRPNYKMYSRIQYKCSPGFEPKNTLQITCDVSGQWTYIQQCTAMCPAPYIPNAEIVGDLRPHYTIGSRIKYRCRTGFDPQQDVEITCDSQHQWTKIQQCTPMCAAPYIPNAEVIGNLKSNYSINSTIEYNCSLGFEPEESVLITCGDQRQWTGIQRCTAMCAAPFISNAEIVGDLRQHYGINSTMEYNCSLGFEPEEPVQITCDSQRRWRGIQQCTAMCAAPYIPNAEIVGELRQHYRINSTVEYNCSLGFAPEQTVNITCDSQHQWTTIQQCTAMCAAPYIPNAEIVGELRPHYTIASRIKYRCRTGFDPKQAVEITCDSQRQWTTIQQCTRRNQKPK